MKNHDEPQRRIRRLLARSSLGSPRALATRSKTPSDLAAEIVLRAETRRVVREVTAHRSPTKNNTESDN